MKLVIDSNIFISSLDPKDIFHSECYPIFERVLSFEIEALCPVLVLIETTCVIIRDPEALQRLQGETVINSKTYRTYVILA